MKSKPIEIRDFRSPDAEACFRIRTEALIKLFYDEIGPDAVVAGINAYLPEKYIRMAETMPISVAVDGEAQIGFIASRFLEHNTIEILFLYIDLDYLRKGIGTQLVRYLESRVRKRHPEIERIIVDTAVPKYNQQFYEKIGYVEVGQSECQYPACSIKAVRLMKKLRSGAERVKSSCDPAFFKRPGK
jgi:ribosomal protein S18 acetylase RimI-like enzyme